ncbi:hypothetical protein [Parageobacillus thermoglucosidasius]|nr:hypothetical protein [Parageobacillus thermoglucosidasius]KYD16548.1 hypothetical protein B4168_1052 [Anoxybacillus flavithermus]OAO88305.1 hypothetical protein GT23_0581 [Parageobacillus thermoglucosidasius]
MNEDGRCDETFAGGGRDGCLHPAVIYDRVDRVMLQKFVKVVVLSHFRAI